MDSDETVFDGMKRKHLLAFTRAIFEVWPILGSISAQFKVADNSNDLISPLWSVNRYLGLLDTFERLERTYSDIKRLPNLSDLRAYVDAETIYSTNTLREWMLKHPSPVLTKVLRWSNRADILFSESCKGLAPFTGVQEALKLAAADACIAVISSAAKEDLERVWTFGGLMPLVDIMMSHENGSKAKQLETAMACCGENVQVMLLGGLENDGVAAHEAGAFFYLIRPGGQEQSWARFKDEILPVFLAGNYDMEADAIRHNEI
ncbi:hypothetical protein LJC74_04100 [Eubacteriales bacterium OttesenSCG-928-A19]|nr:hypothetical protein [Eubacteriales bacterium OttesenSCG-928-A19]